jgi:cytochrome c peroxidase
VPWRRHQIDDGGGGFHEDSPSDGVGFRRFCRTPSLGTAVASTAWTSNAKRGAMKTSGALSQFLVISATASAWLGCKSKQPPAPAPAPVAIAPAPAPADQIDPKVLKRFLPVGVEETPTPPDAAKVTLGRMLFHDKRLSRTGEIACSTCHTLTRFGIDGQTTSKGVNGQRGARNAPSVFNSATHIAQFWDGRASNVEAQASGPIMNPREMAMPNEHAVVAVLHAIPGYVEMFNKAFPKERHPISLRNVGEAIGAFERGLVTKSRWDRFIHGESGALTAQEKHGLKVFLDAGCMACHTGPQVGGTMFQKVGAVIPWPNQQDKGRAAITKSPSDNMVFKVPSLKNISQTAPYFHDGASANLHDAIRLMGYHQLGIKLADDEINAIAIWMRSMTGEIDPAYIVVPELPPSGKDPRTTTAAN